MENQKVNEVDENLLRMTNAAMQVSEGMKAMVDCVRTQYTLIAQLTAGNVVVGNTPVIASAKLPAPFTVPVEAALTPVPVELTTPVIDEPVAGTDGGLDDENQPWDARIHAVTKTMVASKIVKKGKAWRLKKGVDLELVKQLKKGVDLELVKQLKNENAIDVVDAPVAVATPPPVMTPPVVAATPPVMTPPVVDEPIDEYAEIRFEAITSIKILIDVYGLDWADCKEIVTVVTGAAQTGEEVTFGALTYDQYPLIRDKFAAILADYEGLKGIADEVYINATPAHKDMVDGQVKVLLTPFNTESFDGVYYADLDAVKLAVAPWAKQWSDWAIQVANAAQAGQ